MDRVILPASSSATALKSIDLLTDGRVVVLSERERALLDAEGVVAEHDASLAELGDRGLEGLAIRPLNNNASLVAVLWEGGYPESRHVQNQLRQSLNETPLRPLIQVYELKSGQFDSKIDAGGTIELDVPIPPGCNYAGGQRFRAPDLVWHREPDGLWDFIVLLSTTDSSGKIRYKYHWLQRFSSAGKPVGDPIDIHKAIPKSLKELNWEGLAWFEEGKSLVMVNDNTIGTDSFAYVLELPGDWKYDPH